eukprot:2172072-Pyramimonas_sp.AAC.1
MRGGVGRRWIGRVPGPRLPWRWQWEGTAWGRRPAPGAPQSGPRCQGTSLPLARAPVPLHR